MKSGRGKRIRFVGNGFTLVELLVALMVSSIVLSAVATLAFALGRANDAADDTSRKQAQVRYASVRLYELIRQSKLVCAAGDEDVLVWKGDDNPKNGKIDVLELAYIERGSGRNYIKLIEFTDCPEWLAVSFRGQRWQIGTLADNHDYWKDLFSSNCTKLEAVLIPDCSNVEFKWGALEAPPLTRFFSISFDLSERGVLHTYEIDTSLRGWAGNLLSGDGRSIVSDDD